MNKILNLSKKLCAFSVVAMTIVWSMGLVALVPTIVHAETCPTLEAGDLFSVPTSNAVYLVTPNLKRQYFSYPKIFKSWFSDFSGVQHISTACGANYPGAGGVPFRAGSVLAKNTTFPAVYAILPGGKKAHIATAKIAAALYGPNWEDLIVDVADSVLDSYTNAPAIDDAVPHDGMIVKKKGDTKVFQVVDGKYVEVEGTLSPIVKDDVIELITEIFEKRQLSGKKLAEKDVLKDVVMKEKVEKTEEIKTETETEAETEKSTDTTETTDSTEKTTSVEGLVFNSSANYTGPFPAPEGMVLTGTYGSDKFNAPTGNGEYKFRVQTEWKRDIICLDTTRGLVGSKGYNWDLGLYAGYLKAEKDLLYDETPTGTGAGNTYYDEGYKYGYSRGWDDLGYVQLQKDCPGYDATETRDLTAFNSNGWEKFTGKEIDETFADLGLKEMYLPPSPYAGVTYSSQSLLGSNSKSITFSQINNPIHEVDTNDGTDPLNIDQIDVLVGELDASEQALSVEEYAQALFDLNKAELQDKNKVCVLGTPVITTDTYGSNSFTQLSYYQQCASNLNQIAYMIKKSNDGKTMLILYFQNVDMNITEDAKLINASFVSQFLTGVKFE